MEFVSFQAQLLFLSSAVLASHRILFEWKTVLYEYPNEEAEKEAMSLGRYKPEDIFIGDVDRYGKPLEGEFFAFITD